MVLEHKDSEDERISLSQSTPSISLKSAKSKDMIDNNIIPFDILGEFNCCYHRRGLKLFYVGSIKLTAKCIFFSSNKIFNIAPKCVQIPHSEIIECTTNRVLRTVTIKTDSKKRHYFTSFNKCDEFLTMISPYLMNCTNGSTVLNEDMSIIFPFNSPDCHASDASLDIDGASWDSLNFNGQEHGSAEFNICPRKVYTESHALSANELSPTLVFPIKSFAVCDCVQSTSDKTISRVINKNIEVVYSLLFAKDSLFREKFNEKYSIFDFKFSDSFEDPEGNTIYPYTYSMKSDIKFVKKVVNIESKRTICKKNIKGQHYSIQEKCSSHGPNVETEVSYCLLSYDEASTAINISYNSVCNTNITGRMITNVAVSQTKAMINDLLNMLEEYLESNKKISLAETISFSVDDKDIPISSLILEQKKMIQDLSLQIKEINKNLTVLLSKHREQKFWIGIIIFLLFFILSFVFHRFYRPNFGGIVQN